MEREKNHSSLILSIKKREPVEVIESIIKLEGKDTIDSVNYKGRNAIWYSCIDQIAFESYFYLLIHTGANPICVDKDGCSNLHMLIYSNNISLVQEFIKLCNTDLVPILDNSQYPAIAIPIVKKNSCMLRYLVKCLGADVNLRFANGATPLHLVARENSISCLEVLMGCGANPNESSFYGLTPLHIGAFNGHTVLVKFLVSFGADREIIVPHSSPVEEYRGKNALEIAQIEGHTETIDFLRDPSKILDEDCKIDFSNISFERPL